MEAALVALIAVTGTLLGAVVTHVLQRKQTERRDLAEAAERLRDLHMNVYSALAEAAAALRGAQIQRWACGVTYGKDSDRYTSAKAEAFRLQAIARGAMFRVRMLAVDERLSSLAVEMIDLAVAIKDAQDRDELRHRADLSRQVSDAFVAAAARQIAMLAQASIRVPRKING